MVDIGPIGVVMVMVDIGPNYGGYGCGGVYGGGYGYGGGYPPVTYIQRQDGSQAATESQTNDWYYCSNPEGYYPYVKNCPDGWLPVAPQPTAPTVATAPIAPTAPTVPPAQ